jgi:hypothetical protein
MEKKMTDEEIRKEFNIMEGNSYSIFHKVADTKSELLALDLNSIYGDHLGVSYTIKNKKLIVCYQYDDELGAPSLLDINNEGYLTTGIGE